MKFVHLFICFSFSGTDPTDSGAELAKLHCLSGKTLSLLSQSAWGSVRAETLQGRGLESAAPSALHAKLSEKYWARTRQGQGILRSFLTAYKCFACAFRRQAFPGEKEKLIIESSWFGYP